MWTLMKVQDLHLRSTVTEGPCCRQKTVLPSYCFDRRFLALNVFRERERELLKSLNVRAILSHAEVYSRCGVL